MTVSPLTREKCSSRASRGTPVSTASATIGILVADLAADAFFMGFEITSDQCRAARGALQLELFRTLLLIGQTYPRQPEKLDLYMQQYKLQPHTQSPSTPALPPTPPPPAA